MSFWFFHIYIDAAMKEVKMGIGKVEVKFLEGERKWRLPSLHADDCFMW